MQYTKMYVQKKGRGGGGGVITCLLNMLYRKGPNYFLGVNFFWNEVQRKMRYREKYNTLLLLLLIVIFYIIIDILCYTCYGQHFTNK